MNTSKLLNILLATALLVVVIVTTMREPKNSATESQGDRTVSAGDTLAIIHQRKSVRKYTDQLVMTEQLETLAKAGMAAPTAMNRQPWVMVAITDRNVLDKLAKQLPYGKMLAQAPAAIAICGNMNKALEKAGRAFWVQDCSAATENVLLAAEAMGLGAVWIGVYPIEAHVKGVSETLNLPAHLVPLNVISIGYPTGVEKPKNKWKPENLLWRTASK